MMNIQSTHYLPGCASSKCWPHFSGQARSLLRRSALICLILAGGGLSGCAEGIDSGVDSGVDSGIDSAIDSEQAAEDSRIEASRTYANRLQNELGARLKSALASGGPVQAITVCQIEAPGIARAMETEGGPSYVGRTALRVRNRANAPDDEARAILAEFERELGPDAPPPSRFITRADGSARYLQAIPMQPMCIACHGSELSPEVSEALAQRYPRDEATGFAVGDLRGAFLIEWPADAESRIRAARARFNSALENQQLDGLITLFAPDYQLISGRGDRVRGPEAHMEMWRKTFESDPTFNCQRTPDEVNVNADWGLAREVGRWLCTQTVEGAPAQYAGVYAAKWQTTVSSKWVLQSEVFTTLSCEGPPAACRKPDPIGDSGSEG